MKDNNYLNLAHIAGEIWGTQARATMNQPPIAPTASVPEPMQPQRVLGHDVYFIILDKLKADYRKEVTLETEITDGEDT